MQGVRLADAAARRDQSGGGKTGAPHSRTQNNLARPNRGSHVSAMAMQELYIRNATETEARGPFSVQQVADLAEAGQVTAETLIYDPNTEQWVALNTNTELMTVIFPEKKKLSLKAKEIKTLNKPDDSAKPITVNDMLDAAEGRTTDTKGKADPQIAMMRAARTGMIAAIVALIASAAGEILPGVDALTSMDGAKILAQPLVILGVVDVVLAVLLGLGMVTLYPLVRFRAALGFGLVGFMFYAQGFTVQVAELGAGALGLYCCTVFTSLIPVLVAGIAAIGGMGLVSWFLINQ